MTAARAGHCAPASGPEEAVRPWRRRAIAPPPPHQSQPIRPKPAEPIPAPAHLSQSSRASRTPAHFSQSRRALRTPANGRPGRRGDAVAAAGRYGDGRPSRGSHRAGGGGPRGEEHAGPQAGGRAVYRRPPRRAAALPGPLIKEKLGQGITLVVDRYAFSGVAFTSAKENFSLDWCKQPDVGLPKPDLVVFLQLRLAEAAARSEFGQERYEDRAFQEQVLRRFHQLQGDTSLNWKSLATSLYLRPMLPQPGPRDPSQRLCVLRETPSLRAPPDPSMMVDASRSIEEVHQEICTLSKDTIQAAAQRPLGELWK
ncbi:thymidylate kinase isoform X1 [Camelus ferus]|uniref:dTMP kinase n=1 Tax=Camelus ferus TaxID=419612 RepID=A0A8B8T340_CAMFR|nr:thymidylate kinase isoform X1 [Camelus ferus]